MGCGNRQVAQARRKGVVRWPGYRLLHHKQWKLSPNVTAYDHPSSPASDRSG
eukprot:gene5198-1244_t